MACQILSWGDGDLTNLNGYYRNRRGYAPDAVCQSGTCRVKSSKWLPTNQYSNNNLVDTGKTCVKDADCKYVDQCLPESKAANFGQILDKTCDNSYFRFDHAYQCLKGGQGWKAGSACPNSGLATQYGGCCVFKPSVQVKDNWGWCNGSCSDDPNHDSAGLGGCYDALWKTNTGGSGHDECGNSTSGQDPYTHFSGSIIVAPQ